MKPENNGSLLSSWFGGMLHRLTVRAVVLALLVTGMAVLASAPATAAPTWALPWPSGQSHNINGGNSYGCGDHTGADYYAIDFNLASGSAVAAVASGTAHTTSSAGGYGNYIWIDHGGGYSSLYAHLSSFQVGDGQQVAQGQQIALSGSSGNSTGAHLHFVIHYNGGALVPEPMGGYTGFGNYGVCHGGAVSPWYTAQSVASGYDTVFHNLRYPGGGWTGFASPGGTANVVAIAGNYNSSNTQVLEGRPDGLYHNIRFNNGGWNGWNKYNGWNFKSLAATQLPNGDMQVAAVGLDGRAYHNLRYANGAWSGFNYLGLDGVTQITIAGMNDGTAQLMAVRNDGIYHSIRNADGSWNPGLGRWNKFSNSSALSIAAAAMPNGDMQFVMAGVDHHVFHGIRYASGSWTGPTSTGFGGANIVAIAGMYDGSAQVIAGTGNRVYHEVRNADGSWNPGLPNMNVLSTNSPIALAATQDWFGDMEMVAALG